MPFGNTTLLMTVVGTCVPPLASVAYASAISSIVQQYLRPPITSAGLPVSCEVMPIACAVASSLPYPRSSASCAYTVLSDTVVAFVMLITPW